MFRLFTILSVLLASTAYAQPRPPSSFCVDEKCVQDAPTPTTLQGMKWHPGHYMTLDTIRTTPEVRARHMREIEAIRYEPTVKGVKLFVYWGAMEKSQGDYSQAYAIIDEYLAKLKSTNKYLILSIQDRIFGGYPPEAEAEYLPQYIVQAYGKTQGTNVLVLRVWQQPTMDRMIALVKALGARYNSHPNFEMLQAEETSVSVPTGKDGYSISAYGTQTKRLLAEARKAWPNTLLRLSTNYFGSDTAMLDMLAYCQSLDVAIGGPDIIPTETIQANRLYDANYRGKMVWVSEVQSPSLGGHEGTFTAKQIYDSGMVQQPSHFLWYRNTWQSGPAQRWDTGLLPFIRSINGATKTACPPTITCLSGT